MNGALFSGEEMQLVVFRLAAENYAVSILQVQEIKRLTDITRVPQTPEYIKGVMNLRGSVMPVVDLTKRLNLPKQEYTDDTRIIIVKLDDIVVGMVVDAVLEVTALVKEQIERPDGMMGGVDAQFLDGVGKEEDRLLILLNLENTLGLGTEMKVG